MNNFFCKFGHFLLLLHSNWKSTDSSTGKAPVIWWGVKLPEKWVENVCFCVLSRTLLSFLFHAHRTISIITKDNFCGEWSKMVKWPARRDNKKIRESGIDQRIHRKNKDNAPTKQQTPKFTNYSTIFLNGPINR